MRCNLRFLLVGVAISTLLLPSWAQEKKLQKSDLPPAVLKTADQESKGATVRGYSTEVENGQREYEVEMMVEGHSRDVTIAQDGAILEVEEQVQMRDLSPEVQKALRARAKTGTITKIESLTKHGRLVAYEAQVKARGTKGNYYEIQVGPDGNSLAHPE